MGEVVDLKPKHDEPRSQVWTCGCESQLFFLLEDGRCVCASCRCESNVIEVVRRNPLRGAHQCP